MLENWWNELATAQQFFWGIAIIFSVLFFIQFVLSLIGIDFDGDSSFESFSDAAAVDGSYQIDPSFSLFTVRGIIAFFTFFGWSGVVLLEEGSTLFWTLAFALFSGLLGMFVVAYLLFWFSKLGKAANVDIHEAMYKVGEVYLTIPPNRNGQGKIHISLGNSLREMDAISEYFDAIPTGSKVRVIEIIDSELLVVEPYS
jgi:hypothetical protein